MKKITFALLFWLAASFSFVALADLPKDGYFHLKVVHIGNDVDTTLYLSIDPSNPDSLMLLDSAAMIQQLDYSLWSFTVKVSAAGQNAYDIVNKKGLRFAFDEPTIPIKGTDPNDASEAVAMLQPEGALDLWNDISVLLSPDTFSLQSYVGGSTYQLSLYGEDSITIASTAGNKVSKYLFFVTEKPQPRWLAASELNDKLGDGFKLFYYYQDNELTSGLLPQPANGMKFIADTTNTSFSSDSIFYLQLSDTVPNKYLFVDTASYLMDTTKLLYGSKMLLTYDTLPSSFAVNNQPALFSFRIDPGSFKDSVAVFVHGTYGRDTLLQQWDPILVSTPPVSAMTGLIPIQVDAFGGYYYLVTDTLDADPKTRIAFKEIAYPTKLRRGKIYSVKVLNVGVNQNKYMVSTWNGALGYSTVVYDRLPYTQFVYQGNELVNRDAAGVHTKHLYKISEFEDIYTNVSRDTFEIKEMEQADMHSHVLSFAEFSGSLLKENYMIDIMTGGFAGKVVGMSTDSVVGILEDDIRYFKLSPADDSLRVYGGALHYVTPDKKDSVSAQIRQPYYLKSIDRQEYIHVDSLTNQLKVTTTDSTAFYLRKTSQPREYILIHQTSAAQLIVDDTLKVQVNSQSGSLELVDVKLIDNQFRIRPESDIATYLKGARGYYEFTSYLGQRMTKNAAGYAVYRNEGDSVLRSAIYGGDDFKLYIEPALSTGLYASKPSYYIIKDAELGDAGEITGSFLHVLDSGKALNPIPFQVEIGGLYYNRLNFVEGKRVSGDSILVNYDSATPVKADSIGYKGKNERGIKEYRFFLRETDVKDEYMLVSEFGFDGQGNEDGYLSVLNDVLFISPRSSAYTVRVTSTDPPTSNDEVIIDHAIKVISEKGAVTILNAAGKQITVMSILGQMIKRQMVSSDQERIELPQGIVIVNVAGEKAIKAVVK